MKFDNPADAMRARMLGRLNCMFCTHVLGSLIPWCDMRDDDPCPDKPMAECICPQFKDHGSDKFKEMME